MKKIIFTFIITIFCSVAHSAETIVFEGIPLVKNSSSIEGTVNQQLSESGQQSYKIIITKEKNKYIWLSRERRELTHKTDGNLHFFTTKRGDYIRITKNPDGGYLYMEHLTDGFKIITYWDTSNKFEL